MPNRPKIDETSIVDHFGHSRRFRGRVRTRSGRPLDTQMPPQSRSWDAPGEPRAAKLRPKASLDRSADAPGPPRSSVRPRLEHRAPSNALAERFFIDFASSRESSDVARVPVFTVFCWLRTKLGPNARERRKTSKIHAFRPPKSTPGASKIEPGAFKIEAGGSKIEAWRL